MRKDIMIFIVHLLGFTRGTGTVQYSGLGLRDHTSYVYRTGSALALNTGRFMVRGKMRPKLTTNTVTVRAAVSDRSLLYKP